MTTWKGRKCRYVLHARMGLYASISSDSTMHHLSPAWTVQAYSLLSYSVYSWQWFAGLWQCQPGYLQLDIIITIKNTEREQIYPCEEQDINADFSFAVKLLNHVFPSWTLSCLHMKLERRGYLLYLIPLAPYLKNEELWSETNERDA